MITITEKNKFQDHYFEGEITLLQFQDAIADYALEDIYGEKYHKDYEVCLVDVFNKDKFSFKIKDEGWVRNYVYDSQNHTVICFNTKNDVRNNELTVLQYFSELCADLDESIIT